MGHELTPEEAERLLGQGPGSEDPSSGPLAAFVSELRTAFTAAPDTSTRATHLAAMAAIEPQPGTPRPPFRRASRRRGLRGALLGAGLVFVGATAMAATGTLPGPLQDAVANGVEATLGFDIAGGEDNSDNGTPTNERAAANKARSEAYTDAKKAWVACVQEAEKAHEGTEPFDPEVACGEKPNPHDFGIPAKSENASEKTPKPEKTQKPDNTHKPTDPGPPAGAGNDGQGGPPDDAGPPEHAGAPDHAGPPDDAGPPAGIGGGPPSD